MSSLPQHTPEIQIDPTEPIGGAFPTLRELVERVVSAQAAAMEDACNAIAARGYTPADCRVELRNDGDASMQTLSVLDAPVFEVRTTVTVERITVTPRVIRWPTRRGTKKED